MNTWYIGTVLDEVMTNRDVKAEAVNFREAEAGNGKKSSAFTLAIEIER